MQILKAERGKSEVVMLLVEHSRCMTFCYMNENFFIGNPIGENYICGTEHSLDELKDFIIEELKNLEHCNQISFLIVYTNLTESEVQPFGKSLENELKSNDLLCRNILITCKPD